MPGNKIGASKLRQTMIAKFGSEEAWKEHMRSLGSVGGARTAASGTTKGFALMTPEKRRAAGRKGGRISRRAPRTLDS
jgi:general stress protein YciG